MTAIVMTLGLWIFPLAVLRISGLTGRATGQDLDVHAIRMERRRLLVLAFLVPMLFHLHVTFKHSVRPVWTLIVAFLFFAVLIGINWLLERRFPYSEPSLVPIAVFLTGIGTAMLRRLEFQGSSSRVNEFESADASMFSKIEALLANGQLGMTLLALIVVLFLLWSPMQTSVLSKYPFQLSLVPLVLVLTIIATNLGDKEGENGAYLSIRLFGIAFQVVDVIKLLLLISMASYLTKYAQLFSDPRSSSRWVALPRWGYMTWFVVVYVITSLSFLLLNDQGTLLVAMIVCLALFHHAVRQRSWLAVLLFLFLIGASVLYYFRPHIAHRFSLLLDPYVYDGEQLNAQVLHAKIAHLSGGLTGHGFGEGNVQHIFAHQSDYVATAFSADFGLIGVAAVLISFVLLVLHFFKSMEYCFQPFLCNLGLALGLLFFVQTVVVFGSVYGLLPPTGQVLPFVARGGIAMIVFWIALALMIRVSHESRSFAFVY